MDSQMTVASFLNFGIESAKRHFVKFLWLIIIDLIVFGIGTAIAFKLGVMEGKNYALVGILLTILIFSSSFGFIKNTLNLCRGETIDYLDFVKVKPMTMLSFAIATALCFIIISIGSVLFIFPGIILYSMLFLVPFLVIDQDMGPIEAIKESIRLTRGYKMDIYAGYTIGMLASGAILAFNLFFVFPMILFIYVYPYLYLTGQLDEAKNNLSIGSGGGDRAIARAEAPRPAREKPPELPEPQERIEPARRKRRERNSNSQMGAAVVVIVGIIAAAVIIGFVINKKGNPLPSNSEAKLEMQETESRLAEIKAKAASKETAAAAASDKQAVGFTDPRDGQTYKVARIGSQTWIAENLKYNAGGSICYGNGQRNCNSHGRLYTWETAKTACPAGWHLPSSAEWDKLYRHADGASGTESPYKSETAGRHLKAASGWIENGGGTDKFGFAAIPGGSGNPQGRSFQFIGETGYWWSSTENTETNAYYRHIAHDKDEAGFSSYASKKQFLSVRCLQD